MNRYLVNLMRFSVPFILAAAALLLVQGAQIDQAQACRDCPFPMAALHWRLPSGNADVVLHETNIGGGRIQSVIRLIDARTGDLLAIGRLDHLRGRKRLRVEMTDMTGGSMVAELYFEKADRNQVSIKITCQSCNIKSDYLN